MEKASSIAAAPASGERRTGERRGDERRTARHSTQAVLGQIVERLADGIVIVGEHGRIQFANPAAERLFGRRASELVGREFGFPLSLAEATEIEIVRPDDRVVVAELRLVDADWEDQQAMLVSLRDVTDRKQGEERERLLESERRARAEAEAANQAKSEFLAVMSHELRTPLNAVLGYAELLDLGVVGSLTPEQRKQIGRITSSGRHLLGLVNETLDLAKAEAGRLSVECIATSAAEVVESAIVLAQPQAEMRGLTMQSPAEVPRTLQLIGDHDRVLQILANLLSNAVKFTEPGGTISIDVAEATTSVATAHLHADGPWIAIRVCDSGIGIASDHLEAIFSPFVQAEVGHTRRSDGTGLGLTISRRLARLMHGEITAESTRGQGSVFTLWLPAPAPDAAAGSTEPGTLSSPLSRTRGLGDVGGMLMHEMESILDSFVAQLRQEPSMPAAPTLRYSQLADHTGAMLADVAAALITLDESRGAPSSLLLDSSDLQRFIADRHGLQRARLRWTLDALLREHEILRAEIERSVRRCFSDPKCTDQVEESLGVIRRYVEQHAETSRRALERVAHQGARRTD